jgi:Zn-dependent protease with chaperone function
VARIVGALTLVSENPQQAYRITVLNSPAVNAFALPGGYLYVTRGLLALANDASEVAAVLSHEMAHVTANHGLERQRREQEVELAGQVAEELFSNSIAGRQVVARGKLSLAAFSRNQELQADVIGVRMLGEAGYDPFAAARFLESMDANQRFNAVDPDTDTTWISLRATPMPRSAWSLPRTMHAPLVPRAWVIAGATIISMALMVCCSVTARMKAMSAARNSFIRYWGSASRCPTGFQDRQQGGGGARHRAQGSRGPL